MNLLLRPLTVLSCLGLLVRARINGPRSLQLLSAETQAAVDLILNPPVADVVVDDGTPLELCQGHCDEDEDCLGDLICMQRNEGDPIPGCSIDASSIPDEGSGYESVGSVSISIARNSKAAVRSTDVSGNFCGYPFASVVGDGLIPDEGDVVGDALLELCEGSCTSDGMCAEGLICYARGITDPVPGCNVQGEAGVEGHFCVLEIYQGAESSLNAPTPAPTNAPTQSPTSGPTQTPTAPIPEMETTTASNSTVDMSTSNSTIDDDDSTEPPETTASPTSEPTEMPVETPQPTTSPVDTPVPTIPPTLTSTSAPAAATPVPTVAPTPDPTAAPVTPAPTTPVGPTLRPTVGPGPATAAIGTYDNLDWWELPLNVRQAAEVIGYDEESWKFVNDETVVLDIDSQAWIQLTVEEQAALTVFGYDEASWDGEDAWSQLSDVERAAAQALGYDQNSWDYEIPVAVDNLCWVELTSEQQEAAGVLGYDMVLWDQGEC